MRITYIGHSGFLVEMMGANFLFDYYTGEIPVLSKEKPLYVLVSHKHGDHFNPTIFQMEKKYEKVMFLLSYDIKLTSHQIEKYEMSERVLKKTISLRAHEHYQWGDIFLQTLKSTDSGIAFLLKTEGKTIYHAGDLNWWCWEGESKQEANNMTANFKREIDSIKSTLVDIAFLPLDPRQEGLYYLGMEYFMEQIHPRYVFPMHFWEEYTISDKYSKEGHHKDKNTTLYEIHRPGESFTIQ